VAPLLQFEPDPGIRFEPFVEGSRGRRWPSGSPSPLRRAWHYAWLASVPGSFHLFAAGSPIARARNRRGTRGRRRPEARLLLGERAASPPSPCPSRTLVQFEPDPARRFEPPVAWVAWRACRRDRGAARSGSAVVRARANARRRSRAGPLPRGSSRALGRLRKLVVTLWRPRPMRGNGHDVPPARREAVRRSASAGSCCLCDKRAIRGHQRR
jgi:hypothetical protein